MKRWEQAVSSADSRVNNLGRALKGFKNALQRDELDAGTYFRRCAEKVDTETETLHRLWRDNSPPLTKECRQACLWYREQQQRVFERIRTLAKEL